MSGPITRQYGVPNWDDIFGKNDEGDANPQRQPEAAAENDANTIPPSDAAASTDE